MNAQGLNRLNINFASIAKIVKDKLLEANVGTELRNGWTVKDFEVYFCENFSYNGNDEYAEGFTFNEMNIYVISEKVCGIKKKVLKTKKEKIYLG